MNELGPRDTLVKDVAQVSFSHREKEKPGFLSQPGLRPLCAPTSTAVKEARALEYLQLLLLP